MTPRQSAVRTFISEHIRQRGDSPSYQEMGHALQISRLAAFKLCQRLIAQGLLSDRADNPFRSKRRLVPSGPKWRAAT